MSRLHARGLMSRCRLLRCRPALHRELLAAHTPQHVAAVLALGPPLGPAAAAMMAAAEAAAPSATATPSTSGLVEQGTASFPEVRCWQSAHRRRRNPPSHVVRVPKQLLGTVSSCNTGTHMTTPSHTQVPAQAAAVSSPSPSLAPDTLYNAHTRAAALLAAGAAADVGTALASGTARRALAVVRPPGAQVKGRAGACCTCFYALLECQLARRPSCRLDSNV